MRYLFVSCLTVLLSFAAAENIVVNDDSQVNRYTCTDDSVVVVNGSDNQISFSGYCEVVTVNGDNNVLIFDELDTISFNGDRNAVTWQGSLSEQPSVAYNGDDNTLHKANLTLTFKSIGEITEGETSDNPQAVAIGAASESNFACDNHDVSIVGSGLSITLSGQCATVVVVGSGNSISAESIESINLVGAGNQVVYSGSEKPEIVLVGLNNAVTQE